MSNSSSTNGTRWWGYRSERLLPTSERVVRACSVKVGWRWSRLAASAPVKPAAPNTDTVGAAPSATDAPLEPLLDRLDDRTAPLGDLLVGQRPVCGPVGKPDGQRHLSEPDPLGIAVHVEY